MFTKKTMVYDRYMLTLEKKFSKAAKLKAHNLGYENLQKYLYDLLHHAVYGKKHAGGRRVEMTYDDIIMKAITKPTAKSRKLMAWAKERGIYR